MGPLVSRSGSIWANLARKLYRTRDDADREVALVAEAVVVEAALAAEVVEAEAVAEVAGAVVAEAERVVVA